MTKTTVGYIKKSYWVSPSQNKLVVRESKKEKVSESAIIRNLIASHLF